MHSIAFGYDKWNTSSHCQAGHMADLEGDSQTSFTKGKTNNNEATHLAWCNRCTPSMPSSPRKLMPLQSMTLQCWPAPTSLDAPPHRKLTLPPPPHIASCPPPPSITYPR